MLPTSSKGPLTLHSVITPSWLSESRRSFLYSSSVYSCHLFLISSASVRSLPFLSFIVLYWAHLCMKCSLCISNFLERSLSFPFFFFPISLHWSRGRLFYLSLLFFGTLPSDRYIFPFLLCFQLLFFSQLFVRSPDTTILPFSITFSWGWSCSSPLVQCHEPP